MQAIACFLLEKKFILHQKHISIWEIVYKCLFKALSEERRFE